MSGAPASSRNSRAELAERDSQCELYTITDTSAVAFRGTEVLEWTGLEPDTAHDRDGASFRTLPVPPGERLATFATVNDVHFGETVCGLIEGDDGPDSGPVFRAEPGEAPYPETMNGAVVEEIDALAPDAVLVKGDLTNDGTDEEYEAFLRCYRRFGDRLTHVRGNHDSYRGQAYAAGTRTVVLPGAVLAVLDTTKPYSASGWVPPEQIEWLDDLAAAADRPVLVFGHHHPWDPGSARRSETYFGINPADSEALVDVVARRPSIAGYFAGHTHRNRVRRFAATGAVPWVEVACVKDYPGAWAEYRVHDGAVVQIAHRARRPDALRWTERTRHMFGGLYWRYALGPVEHRCFLIPTARGR
ncbi:MAG TPA: metallophosphoesterase [Acidimicrobiales bacterium]|nr:metallophosphoesterase [Acidimicrobiales bacterium]